jgi:hypothetical protein
MLFDLNACTSVVDMPSILIPYWMQYLPYHYEFLYMSVLCELL